MEPKQTIVVLGAGYAGVLAANRLAGRLGKGNRILLVSERDTFVHRVRLHEVAAGRPRKAYPLRALVHPRVERVQARVTRIDADARHCVLAGFELPLAYDYLVYAAGSGVATGAPGVRAHGMALAGPEQAGRFAARLRGLPAGAGVSVVGAGLSGIESAAEIAEAFPHLRVKLLGEAFAPDWPEAVQAHARHALADMGVTLCSGARVQAIEDRQVVLADGVRIEARAAVWAAGFSASGLARASGLAVDGAGRLVVDECLRVPGYPEIVGCGDAVAVPRPCVGRGAASLRMACATAMPMGAHAADVVAASVRGRIPGVFRYKHTVQCVSFGRRRGLVVFLDQDDRPTGRMLTGQRGALAKELICRLVIGALHLERHMPGFYRWNGQSSRPPAALGAGRPPRLLGGGDTSDTMVP